jgi:hypothetical protein
MYSKHEMKAQLRGLGSAAVTGILVSMLATTQMFAQSATIAPAQKATTTTSATTTVPQTLQMSTEGAADTGVSSNSTIARLDLPAAPAPTAEANPGADPALGQQISRNLTSDTNNHKVKRPGQLAVGIIGAGIFAFGTYVTTKATRDQAAAAALFMTPGAVMMGFGFTLAFKPKSH